MSWSKKTIEERKETRRLRNARYYLRRKAMRQGHVQPTSLTLLLNALDAPLPTPTPTPTLASEPTRGSPPLASDGPKAAWAS